MVKPFVLACWAGILLATTLMACSGAAPPATLTPEGTPVMVAPSPTPPLVAMPTSTIPPSPTPAATATPEPARPSVSISGARFTVEVAVTPEERSRGLSGRPHLAPGTGMLFVFPQPGFHQFWMVDMRFHLDFVWIGADCVVVDLTPDVPPPGPDQGPGDLPRYRPAQPAQYVLELNAGEIASADIGVGDAVSFQGVPPGASGC